MEIIKVVVVMVVMIMVFMASPTPAMAGNVTYDGKSLIINGSRRILFSGSIHYPRSTPEMWPFLIGQAKKGGLDVIQTYVFWNVHEPIQGQFNFQGRYDLVRFIKEIRNQGLYVSLRIGPFIESEWKYGGFPFWLHDIPGIVFRSDNEPFKLQMQKFVSMIVNMLKSEGLYASQGGPIILSQIENEYQMVEGAFHEKGPPYVKWAASMAVSLNTSVPWMMCKQDDAPDPVINTCNGLRCGETFVGPNKPNKPAMWTENWVSLYQVFGGEPYKRSAEDIAFHVALFIAKMNGSFVNYYMYHGGTNFGKFASAYVTTSYYDQAPLDEYGLIRQPKWGHLKDLHAAVKQSSEALLSGKQTTFSLGQLQQASLYKFYNAYVFQANSQICAAFLVNNDTNQATVKFQNAEYLLPKKSISILPDCKTAVFNTATVKAQSGVRSSTVVKHLNQAQNWGAFADGVSNIGNASFTQPSLLEQLNITKDATDYLWYTVSYDYATVDDQLILQVNSSAHVLHAFVNNEFIGSQHGSHNSPGVIFEKSITLKNGNNDISLLSVMVGSPDSGAYLERRVLGLQEVKIQGKKSVRDLSNQVWGYKVGLQGEKMKIYSKEGSEKVEWKSINTYAHQHLIWYKTTFDAPSGRDPVVLNLGSMGKGEVWINGENIGRYWISFQTPNGHPSQTLYHIPRSFLKPSGNLLVLFEEEGGGDPLNITLETISISSVFAAVSEHKTQLHCYRGKRISTIDFACLENHSVESPHSQASKAVVAQNCLGRRSCSIPVLDETFGGDTCPGTSKRNLGFSLHSLISQQEKWKTTLIHRWTHLCTSWFDGKHFEFISVELYQSCGQIIWSTIRFSFWEVLQRNMWINMGSDVLHRELLRGQSLEDGGCAVPLLYRVVVLVPSLQNRHFSMSQPEHLQDALVLCCVLLIMLGVFLYVCMV
ncbi:hypothetical protein J5N97_022376 [Dioscorea zingiberensis]|uniref:Beta-galactosidase n=1 Tax=Dioscorea zingiberensis TaxID=325984 RepID=A0A9D5HAL3_9LILI|nr:hypothetical protein J5N97_022376 [Dioscorea zingiberensis]